MAKPELFGSDNQPVDTAAISDAMDSLGIECALMDIKPLQLHGKLYGPAFTVQYEAIAFSGNFQSPVDYIEQVPAGAIIVIDNHARTDCTVWGDILTEQAVLKKIGGVVINGMIRDHEKIMSSPLNIFAKGYFMRSGKNRVRQTLQGSTLTIQQVTISPGDLLAGDENGVVVIPKQMFPEVINRAKNIARRESLILTALRNGISLAEARKKYRYDQPWLPLESP